MGKNLLNTENLIVTCEALILTPQWRKVMACIGASEATAYQWRARSMADQKADLKEQSPFWILFRERWRYWHEAILYARLEALTRYESIIREECMSGVLEKIYDGKDVVWETDESLIAQYEGDAELARLMGVHDPFFRHDSSGARIAATRRILMPATLRAKVLEQISSYRQSATLDVNVRGHVVAEVGKAYLTRPQTPALPPPQEHPSITALRERAKLAPKNPRPDGQVQIFSAKESGPPERISNASEDFAQPALVRAEPQAEPPQPKPPAPDYSRKPSSGGIDKPGTGRGEPPPGGFKMQ
jgi:hypothetical protein